MASFDIPIIDVSPFFRPDQGNEELKKKAMEKMREAYGFFQIANHGIPLDLLSRAMDMYKIFFASSDEIKLSLPNHYLKSTQNSAEIFEHLLYRSSSSSFDVCLNNAPHFK
ncbi:hypothetical protein CQW23_11733 [Capsicum baccatum]|uniref:Non-haem dioxygenase N-terminal domain-containing protein n=1 Tax=Capsicum baccatum TaxID=33114 RepID=A0A2G2WQJ8_CAPBA|nr:hypothetical protein CQW23_11733 [Capsicum baccatum]